MRAVGVVVVHELAQDSQEVAPIEDKHPVEALPAEGPDEALGEGVGLGCPYRSADDLDASDRKTSSKLAVNLVSRSQTSHLVGMTHALGGSRQAGGPAG